MTTLTLTDFLKARLDEDESLAREASAYAPGQAPEPESPEHVWWMLNGERWTPARVLAEVEAKRQIVVQYEGHVRHVESGGSLPSGAIARDVRVLYGALRSLALPYADHPDFREEWRP